MEELGLVGDLAIVAAAAVVGGVIARLLRLPTVLGYLAAGIVIGPNSPGPSTDVRDVQLVADLGVALLMFTLGIQFSIRELNEYRRLAVVAGLGVTVAMVGAGAVVGLALGLTEEQAIVAGMATAISSTMLALRMLEDRGLLGAPAGRIAIVTSLVGDLTVVVMLVLIPLLGGEEKNLALELLWALGKALALLAGVWVVGTLVLPRVLGRIAVSRSRELFLITMVALALGTATLSHEAGLSLAFGAFLAGLIISESEYAHRTLAEVIPLREVFAVVFFVAIGMLINPDSFIDDPDLVVGIGAVGIFVKIVLLAGAGLLLGYPARAVVPAAVALGNMGEFSFVLASQALNEGVINAQLNEAILASVLVTIAISPLLFMGNERALAWAESAPVFGTVLRPRTDFSLPEETRVVNHAIIVGYTRAGREVADALTARSFKYVVIDDDTSVFRELSTAGVPVILGDASVPAILERADVERARVLVITVQDPLYVQSVAALARRLNRRLDIVARAVTDEDPARLREIGASRVVEAEFEVGQQFVRHTLQRFGMTSQEVQVLLLARRQNRMG